MSLSTPISLLAEIQRLHLLLRVIAAAIAGWISLTMASFCAGIELGIQPILEHTADGVPLYMPYTWNVTVPAMVLEHALAFSILEALITAIIFAYILRTDTSVFYGEKSEAEINRTEIMNGVTI